MPTTILANSIPISMHPDRYEAAVQKPMQHTTDDWQANLEKLNDPFGVEVTIGSPTGKSWSREFCGLKARPEHIRRTIEDMVCLLE